MEQVACLEPHLRLRSAAPERHAFAVLIATNIGIGVLTLVS